MRTDREYLDAFGMLPEELFTSDQLERIRQLSVAPVEMRGRPREGGVKQADRKYGMTYIRYCERRTIYDVILDRTQCPVAVSISLVSAEAGGGVE